MFVAAPIIPNDYLAVTPSDTAALPEGVIGLLIPSAGIVKAQLRSGTTITITTTVENTIVPGAFKMVLAEGTTATGLLAAVR